MVARPAPLEGLKVRVGGKGYEFLHEAVAVAESTFLESEQESLVS